MMDTQAMSDLAVAALEELKAQDMKVLDVAAMTSITDVMIIVTGTSNRHVRSLAGIVVEKAKHSGVQPLGVEGEDDGDWVLVDLGGVVIHVMTARTRDFYQLEKLWSMNEEVAENEPA